MGLWDISTFIESFKLPGVSILYFSLQKSFGGKPSLNLSGKQKTYCRIQ
jgi:hypothetical protein